MASAIVQIFGTRKCKDTQKAERFFKERRIRIQRVALEEKAMSKGEIDSVCRAIGGSDKLVDPGSKEFERLGLKYVRRDWVQALMEHPMLTKTPVVRVGTRATVGHAPDVWESWIKDGLVAPG